MLACTSPCEVSHCHWEQKRLSGLHSVKLNFKEGWEGTSRAPGPGTFVQVSHCPPTPQPPAAVPLLPADAM